MLYWSSNIQFIYGIHVWVVPEAVIELDCSFWSLHALQDCCLLVSVLMGGTNEDDVSIKYI